MVGATRSGHYKDGVTQKWMTCSKAISIWLNRIFVDAIRSTDNLLCCSADPRSSTQLHLCVERRRRSSWSNQNWIVVAAVLWHVDLLLFMPVETNSIHKPWVFVCWQAYNARVHYSWKVHVSMLSHVFVVVIVLLLQHHHRSKKFATRIMSSRTCVDRVYLYDVILLVQRMPSVVQKCWRESLLRNSAMMWLVYVLTDCRHKLECSALHVMLHCNMM